MKTKYSNHSFYKNSLYYLAVISGFVFSIGLRLVLLPSLNHDLTDALIPWYDYMIRYNGLNAINGLLDSTNGFPAYIYSPPYLYLLAAGIPLVDWLGIVPVIKLISIVFDFFLAAAVFMLVRLKFPDGWKKWAAFFVVSFAPTVWVNSAFWGQFDGIYTAMLAICLYFICTRRFTLSLVFFATAIAFKIQAVLFAPLYLILLFQRKLVWWKYLLIPAVFFIWMIPAYLSGYPLLAPFTTYMGGATQFQSITMNTPNLYTFLPNQFYRLIVPVGTLAGIVICILLMWQTLRRHFVFTIEQILIFTVMISVVMPYVLPKMHERYYYPAALFSIVLMFYLPRLRLIPLVLQVTSLLSYIPFLGRDELITMVIPAIYNGILAVVLLYLFFNQPESAAQFVAHPVTKNSAD